MTPTTKQIKDNAPVILQAIKEAKKILLHCHPSPDPDSVGSALAMKFALEQLGKNVTVIKGDSDIPEAFWHFPGCSEIVKQNYFETDLAQYDLFIIQDSGSKEMISRKGEVIFTKNLKTIVIDHHSSNNGYGDINLVEATYPATTQILADLFMEWKIEMNKEIASNLFVGLYSDTLFKYPGVTPHTFEVASRLVEYVGDVSTIIGPMETSFSYHEIAFKSLALRNIKTYMNDHLAISAVSLKELKNDEVNIEEIRSSFISSELRTIKGWYISVSLVETKENYVEVSIRSQDGNKYDVSKLAVALGGGGHKAAAGSVLKMPLKEAVALLLSKAEGLYNL